MVKPRSSLKKLGRASDVPLPSHIPVELAILQKEAPEGDAWLHEAKFDGYRMLARMADGPARLITRNDQDWTHRFPELAETFTGLGLSGTVLDGEIVKFGESGIRAFCL